MARSIAANLGLVDAYCMAGRCQGGRKGMRASGLPERSARRETSRTPCARKHRAAAVPAGPDLRDPVSRDVARDEEGGGAGGGGGNRHDDGAGHHAEDGAGGHGQGYGGHCRGRRAGGEEQGGAALGGRQAREPTIGSMRGRGTHRPRSCAAAPASLSTTRRSLPAAHPQAAPDRRTRRRMPQSLAAPNRPPER